MNNTSSSTTSNIDVYADYYKKPDWWFYFRYDTQVKLKTVLYLCKKVSIPLKKKTVCELGFGNRGALFEFDKSSQLYGIEISDSAIQKANERAAKKGYHDYYFSRWNDSGILPFENNTIDIVIASHVIEHIPNEDLLINEIRRILKFGGIAIILIPINERFEDPKHIRKYNSKICKEAFENFGFHTMYELENELIYYIVEKMYWKYQNEDWPLIPNLFRIIFNFSFSRLPYRCYQVFDYLIKVFLRRPPRQAAFVFNK